MNPRRLPGGRAVSRLVGVLLAVGAWTEPGVLPASGPDRLVWHRDLARARREALESGRLLWVRFTGPWCHFCRKMEAEAGQSPRLPGLVRGRVVPVELRSDEHEEWALGLGFTSLPANVVLGPDGRVVAKAQGYLDPDALHAFLADAVERGGLRARGSGTGSGEAAEAGGSCVVTLVERHRLVAGRPSVTARHDGRLYRFADAAARDRFVRSPERYVPRNGGRCPVAQVDGGEARAGTPACGVLHEGHLYFCSTPELRKRFLDHPERYARVDHADRAFCPHCWDVASVRRARPSEPLVAQSRRPGAVGTVARGVREATAPPAVRR